MRSSAPAMSVHCGTAAIKTFRLRTVNTQRMQRSAVMSHIWATRRRSEQPNVYTCKSIFPCVDFKGPVCPPGVLKTITFLVLKLVLKTNYILLHVLLVSENTVSSGQVNE